jgi:hypothetical protein
VQNLLDIDKDGEIVSFMPGVSRLDVFGVPHGGICGDAEKRPVIPGDEDCRQWLAVREG